MNKTKALLTGLLLLIVLWILMMAVKWHAIESQIAQSVSSQLEGAGFDSIAVHTDKQGRDVVLSGFARSQQRIDEIATLVSNVRGVREVDYSRIELRSYTPSRLDLAIDNNRVVISGQVQTQAELDALVSAMENLTGYSTDIRLTLNSDVEALQWAGQFGEVSTAIPALEKGKITISGADVELEGLSRVQVELDDLVSALEQLDGISSVKFSEVKIVPLIAADLGIKVSDGILFVSGNINSREIIDDLLDTANTVFGSIDATQIVVNENVRDAPWVGLVKSVIPVLAEMISPGFSVSGRSVILTGSVRSPDAVQTLQNWIDNIREAGYLITSSINLIPWQNPSLEVEYGAGKMVISGILGRQSLLDTLTNDVRVFATELDISAVSTSREVKNSGWIELVARIIPLFQHFKYGSLSASVDYINMQGAVETDYAEQTIRHGIGQVLGSQNIRSFIDLDIRVELGEAAVCEQKIDTLLKRNTVHFETESAVISEESYPLLDKLIDVIGYCADAIILIDGHTDYMGEEGYNQDLSERRANAAFEYFVKKGIDAGRLQPRGYGLNRPVADNKTREGRAVNRRIELNIINSR